MKFENIPNELRQLSQWCVWRYEDVGARKPTKVPYGKDNKHVDVTNSASWITFNEACGIYNNGDYSGVGFVFSGHDPYAFIDLDDPSVLMDGTPNPNYQSDLASQIKIFREFDSYSERSPSGKGLHVIIKGEVVAGRRRSFIEVYSSNRYATFTGDIYSDRPIINQQEKLSLLWNQMGGGNAATYIYGGDQREKNTDDYILQQAENAVNGDKFRELYKGSWLNLYPSQSEADFALIDIFSFYTQNRNQITRLFRRSALGQRDKARRKDYIERMINQSFDRMLPPIDFDGFHNIINLKVAEVNQLQLPMNAPPVRSSIPMPPGLMGAIAQFIYHAAPRPVPEIAVAGAIGLMAGICGRAYNVSNTGLNQYVLLLAKTGMGKEGMRSGIDKLMNAVRTTVPTSKDFIGPNHIASGQALIKYIHKKSQCFVSILGEFGITIQNISSDQASSHERILKQVLLELYNMSGHTDVYRPSIQADLEKNTEPTNSPSFSILGESTPHSFYSVLNEEMIIEGLLPRFMLIEYDGARPDLNEQHATAVPPFDLVEKFSSLVANCAMIMHANRTINILFTPDAEELANNFDRYATAQINNTQDEVVLNLWNRAHLKAIKFAGLIAVGVNMNDPIINIDNLNMAISMVQSDIKALSAKFEKGEVGHSSSETKQIKDVIRMLKEYVIKDWESIKKYCITKNDQNLHIAKVVPYAYLSKRLVAVSSYRNDRLGPTNALKRSLSILLDSDKIREVGKKELADKFGTNQRCFVISDVSVLD